LNPLEAYRQNATHLFGYPDSTLSEYLRDLENYELWAAQRSESGNGRSPREVLLGSQREEIEAFLVALSQRGLKATSINRKIYSLSSFYIWAVHNRLLDGSPLAGICRLKIPRRIPKFLTFEEIQRLLAYTGSPALARHSRHSGVTKLHSLGGQIHAAGPCKVTHNLFSGNAPFSGRIKGMQTCRGG
jgi:site-specific recombinase XerD